MNRRRQRGAIVLAAAVLLLVVPASATSAHAVFVGSNPVAGATLGASPTAIELSFSEVPEPSLSKVQVLDRNGTAHTTGPAAAAHDEPRTLTVPVGMLERAVYTVQFVVVSQVDGHRTSGSFAFGVGISPDADELATTSSEGRGVPWLELSGRWLLIVGLVALLGSSWAAGARFGATLPSRMAVVGWGMAVVGLLVLAEAQRRSAGSSIGDLLSTRVGRSLEGRALGLAVAGGALVAAARATGRWRQAAPWIAVVGASGAVAAHVTGGHAAVGDSWVGATIAFQWVHFTAVGVWMGGLAALLVWVQGAPSPAKSSAVRRYANVALVAFLIVAGSGVARGLGGIDTRHDLTSTTYGKAMVAKVILLGVIAGLAALQRWRSIPALGETVDPLRRRGAAELTLAVGAMALAGVLSSVGPPAALGATDDLTTSGVDAARTVEVDLTRASDQSGPNRFEVRANDADTGAPYDADRVTLRFEPLDDPGIPPTTLELRSDREGEFSGTGTSLAFDGRWRISVVLEAGADSVVVPLEVEVAGPPQFLSLQQVPGESVRSTVYLAGGDSVVVWAEPERAGPAQVFATFRTALGEPLAIDRVVVTVAPEDGPAEQRPVTRLGPNEFVAETPLELGSNTVTVVARTARRHARACRRRAQSTPLTMSSRVSLSSHDWYWRCVRSPLLGLA